MNLEPVNLNDAFRVTFNPQEDISAYELAQVLCLLLKGIVPEEEIKKLGLAQRHIKTESIELFINTNAVDNTQILTYYTENQ